VQRMVATRLDIARRLGGLLSAAQKGGLTFCDISFTPKVTDGLSPMTPNLLAEFLINPDRALRSSTTPETENKKTVGQKS
jgi:flagellar biosynthesis protein FlhF